ncbi:MAG: DivIVA domain-containing protein [Actinomycetota bacterium]
MPRKQKETDETRSDHSAAEAKRITPVDIQQKEFRLAFRGYNERDVDQFLDQVTEEVARLHAENKRLREELSFKRTAPLDRGTPGEADAIVRQAREEAGRIVAEARARASTLAASATGLTPTGLLGPFLAREREFLQSLAALIQGHADAVKEGIRQAREEFAKGAEADRPHEGAPAEQEGVRPEEEFAPAGHGTDEAPVAASSEGIEPEGLERTDEEAGGRDSSHPQPVHADDRDSLAGAPAPAVDRSGEAPEGSPQATLEEAGTDQPPAERDRSKAATPASSGVQDDRLRPRERVMDLTDEAGRKAGRQEPEPAGAVPGDREDRSLREFFWGED